MGGRVEAIARELPEQVKRLESAADKKVVDAAGLQRVGGLSGGV